MSVNVTRWQDLALCQFLPPDMFFEEYEADQRTAKLVDDICLSCPVRQACLDAGEELGAQGVWGGIYLMNGKPWLEKNAHKTPEVWKQVKE